MVILTCVTALALCCNAYASALTGAERAEVKAEYAESVPEDGGFVKLSSGKYALANSAGEPDAVFSASAREDILRRASGVAVDSGDTAQTASSVGEMTSSDIAASEAMHADLQAELAADSAQGVVDNVTTLSRGIGVLPSWDAVADALSASTPVVLVGGAAAVGVAIGTGIDELVGLPTLFSSSKAEVIEEHCWETLIHDCKYSVKHPAHAKLDNHFPCTPGFSHGGATVALGAGTCVGFEWKDSVAYSGVGSISGEPFSGTQNCGITFIYTPAESCFGAGTSAEVRSDEVIPPTIAQYTYPDGDVLSGVVRSGELHDETVPQKELCELSEGVELPSGCPEVEAPKPVTTPIAPAKTHVGGPLETYVPHYCEEHKESECSPEHGTVPDPTLPEIPQPETDELATHYVTRLEVLGFTDITVRTRPEVDIDPEVGPDEVAGVKPEPGSRVGTATPVEVEANPADAPAPEEGGGIGPPTEPGIKLPTITPTCTGFPFGVPCWIYAEFSSWSATAKAPEWGIEGLEIKGHKIEGKFDLAKLEPIMVKVRPFMVLFATIGLVVIFYKWATGKSAGESGGDSDPGGSDGSDE